MSTEIATLSASLAKLTKQQRWCLRYAERIDTTELDKERMEAIGLYRHERYRFGTHHIDIAKTEDNYSSDQVIINDFPPAAWSMLIKKACETWKKNAMNKLDHVLSKVEADIKILKRTDAADIIEKMPGDVYYHSIFE